MKRSYLVAAILLIGVFAGTIVLAQSAGAGSGYDLSWHRIAGGGETSSSGSGYELGGTIGQHEAGVMSGGAPGDQYTLAGGFWAGDVTIEVVTCPADLTGPENEPDGVVDVFDLLQIISQWGPCNDPSNCPADISGPDNAPDGVVDVFDLLKVISEWGVCL